MVDVKKKVFKYLFISSSAKKDNNADVWKYNLFLFSSFYYPKCSYGYCGKKSVMAEMHTRGRRCGFSMKPLCLSASFCPVQDHPWFISFFCAHAILVVTPTRYTWTRFLPLTQLTRYFHRGNTSVLFTLGNWCTSCHATDTTYVACQRDLPVNIQHMISLVKFLCLMLWVI